MANQETAYGLRPIGLVGSGANSTGVTQYEIASNNTNAIFQYSICVPLAAGVIDQAGATSGGTTQALGVLMGVEYQDSVSKKPVFINYWPGSGSVSVDTNFPVKAFVADNPNQLFKVASDATLTDRATALAAVSLMLRSVRLPARVVQIQGRPTALWVFLRLQPRLLCHCELLASLMTKPIATTRLRVFR